MFKVLILAVALAAFASCAPADDRGFCAGCPENQDLNDPEILKKVTVALAEANSKSIVKRIVSYKTQVVAGTKHIVEYETEDDKKCSVSWVEQPWLSKSPRFVKPSC